jgi:hypothetical protein
MAGVASVIAVLAVAAACVSLLSTPTASDSAHAAPKNPVYGQAAFAGTWTGTVHEPGWTVTRWAIELVIPASGVGQYRAPSLGCSGSFRVGRITGRTMAGRAMTAGPLNTGCVRAARVTLALGGPRQASLTWAPRSHSPKIGSAELTRSSQSLRVAQDGRSSR